MPIHTRKLSRRQALALGAAAALAAAGSAMAQQRDIVIGQVAPLSGVLADTGREMVLGGQIYFAHVNATGGVHGRPIRHVVKDDGYEVEKTVALTRELLEKDKAVALFGYAGTGNIGKLLQEGVLAQGNVALVAPYTGGESLRDPFNPWIFHLRAGYADETRVMVHHFLSSGMTRIAVMHQDDAFGHAGLAGVEAALKAKGLQPVARGSYPKNTDDVAQAVKTIAAANPQAIVIISVNRSSAAFIRQYRETGKQAQMFNISVVNAQELARLGGAEAVRGVGITQVVPSPFAATLAVVKEYQALLKAHGPRDAKPSYTSFEEFLGAKVLVEGLRRSKALSREGVMHALEGLNVDLGGFSVAYSPNDRMGSSFVDITVIGQDGKLIR